MLTTAPRTFSTVFLSVLVFAKQLVDLSAHLLQRLGLGGDIDVDHAPNLVVIHFRWRIDQLDVRNRAQRRVTSGVVAAPQFARLAGRLVSLLHGAEPGG